MEFNDVLGLGKVLPLDKLLDVLQKAVGRVSKSYFDKKDIETKAYEIKLLAVARAEEIKIVNQAISEATVASNIEYKDKALNVTSSYQMRLAIPAELEDRTSQRIAYQDAKNQLNLESVVAYAAQELENETSVSQESLDEDWINRFFKIAEDISNDEMRALWGRILAGEIKHPKSYSLRTLDVLKNLSKDEAEVFTKFSNAIIFSEDKCMAYNPDDGLFLKNEFGITFTNLLLLTELGLILTEKDLEFSIDPTNDTPSIDFIKYGKKIIVLNRGTNVQEQSMPVIVVTKAGTELSKLIDITYNENYLKSICKNFVHENVIIEYGELVNLEESDEIKIDYKILYQD